MLALPPSETPNTGDALDSRIVEDGDRVGRDVLDRVGPAVGQSLPALVEPDHACERAQALPERAVRAGWDRASRRGCRRSRRRRAGRPGHHRRRRTRSRRPRSRAYSTCGAASHAVQPKAACLIVAAGARSETLSRCGSGSSPTGSTAGRPWSRGRSARRSRSSATRPSCSPGRLGRRTSAQAGSTPRVCGPRRASRRRATT